MQRYTRRVIDTNIIDYSDASTSPTIRRMRWPWWEHAAGLVVGQTARGGIRGRGMEEKDG